MPSARRVGRHRPGDPRRVLRVRRDLAERVVAACPPGAAVVIPQRDGTIHLDLIAAVRSQLEAAGVGDVEDSGICTACRTDEWFSHRAEKKTGRFGSCWE